MSVLKSIKSPASDPLKKPFTVINDPHERMLLADLLDNDLIAIKKIKPECTILVKFFDDFRRDLRCSSQESYWPKIYTQESNADFPSLIIRLADEINRITAYQEKLIGKGEGIDANVLISPKGFKNAEHLLIYWENIQSILES
jgi:hypothetical protein